MELKLNRSAGDNGRRILRGIGRVAAAWCLLGAMALAQQPGTPPDGASGSPPGGGTSVVVSGRTLYVEVGLVLAMFGAVLFAVCRSSRRN